jgi:hypothetical protein
MPPSTMRCHFRAAIRCAPPRASSQNHHAVRPIAPGSTAPQQPGAIHGAARRHWVCRSRSCRPRRSTRVDCGDDVPQLTFAISLRGRIREKGGQTVHFQLGNRRCVRFGQGSRHFVLIHPAPFYISCTYRKRINGEIVHFADAFGRQGKKRQTTPMAAAAFQPAARRAITGTATVVRLRRARICRSIARTTRAEK